MAEDEQPVRDRPAATIARLRPGRRDTGPAESAVAWPWRPECLTHVGERQETAHLLAAILQEADCLAEDAGDLHGALTALLWEIRALADAQSSGRLLALFADVLAEACQVVECTHAMARTLHQHHQAHPEQWPEGAPHPAAMPEPWPPTPHDERYGPPWQGASPFHAVRSCRPLQDALAKAAGRPDGE